MKRFFFIKAALSGLLFAALTFAGRSEFPSTIPDITIPNAHYLSDDQFSVLRGSAPEDHELQQLIDFGVTDVLIFRKQKQKDVEDRIALLEELGIPKDRVHYIPFRWEKFESFRSACRQTLKALRILRQATWHKDRSVFFHCTYGEDRTGHLSGLYRALYEKNTSIRKIFRSELCRWGYGGGDPDKPEDVVRRIRAELTRIFLKIAYKIDREELSLSHLDLSACDKDPSQDESTRKDFWKFVKKEVKYIECTPQNP